MSKNKKQTKPDRTVQGPVQVLLWGSLHLTKGETEVGEMAGEDALLPSLTTGAQGLLGGQSPTGKSSIPSGVHGGDAPTHTDEYI